MPDPNADSSLNRTNRLVPFLLALGPLWMALFAFSDTVTLRLAGVVGALALSLGLILLLFRQHVLEEKIAELQARLQAHETAIDQERAE